MWVFAFCESPSSSSKPMKIFFSLLLALGMAASALAQGKVRLVNDSLHLVYFLSPGGGQAYLPGMGGQTLAIELWAGTSSTALSLQARTDFTGQNGPGTWPGMNVTMASIPAGPAFFAIDIYDEAAGSYLIASTTPGHLFGTSGLFTASASSTIAYNSLVNHNSPANSTWSDGTYNMDFLSPGFRGAIALGGPEPSTFALSCLGLAMLLLRRRADTTKIQK
jgi:hypothetical protein